jgi:YfiH family protein
MALSRIESPNGVVWYQSPLLAALGVTHGFSTRIGGVSDGDFSSLNFGNAADAPQVDPPANITENFLRLQEAIGAHTLQRASVKQVHGRGVELLEREPEGEYGETLDAELRDRFSGQTAADGIVSLVPNVLLVIRVADCVPVLLAGPNGKIVAAVHAGWRGIVGDIAGRAVRTMGEAGTRPQDIVAAIGPCISADHFEVGEEVAEAFTAAELRESVGRREGWERPHLDLPGAVRAQLVRAGVTQIDGGELCTFARPEEFFSYRRDNGRTGRMVAVISAR